ncbi:hypothetical protein KR50_07830 [Jeotgalibacillus campisalis]|uniref:Uncharacterized protein n=1 Tax=Jeotgalibacillus campisalis TaxID=220754 RepID=A0A0C2VPR0_9BACL|nr:hypothetical protein KR50_07830 [Jeotgalibacillus campisalis]
MQTLSKLSEYAMIFGRAVAFRRKDIYENATACTIYIKGE